MEGETYASISGASESLPLSYPVLFLRGEDRTKGFFHVLIEKRLTRSNYLVKDISGTGILSVREVPSSIFLSVYTQLERQKEKKSLLGKEVFIIGSILEVDQPLIDLTEGEDQKGYPFLSASSLGIFSYSSALQLIL